MVKAKLGIPPSHKVILFCGKFISKKKPLDLLKAFIKLGKQDCWLVMVGEGELRDEMEELINRHRIENVILTGFVNQTEIAEYYVISNVFVMCSTIGETWGLSTNEAMTFNLPVVLSDLTGSAYDLVEQGVNGYIFETGNIDQLAEKVHQVLYENTLTWSRSSSDVIKNYSYDTILDTINTLQSRS